MRMRLGQGIPKHDTGQYTSETAAGAEQFLIYVPARADMCSKSTAVVVGENRVTLSLSVARIAITAMRWAG